MRRLALLPLAFLLLAPAAARAEVSNRIVLRVNEQIATLRDYEERRQDLTRDISRRPNMDPEERKHLLEQAPELVFRDLFQELLLESRAQQVGVEVPRAQIDSTIANMKENFGLKTDEEFRQALAQSGLTEPQLRSQLEKQLRIRDLMDREVRSRVKLNEEDLRRYYRKNEEQFRLPEQVHLREVVVLDEGGLPTAEERTRAASDIRQAVAGGKPLEDAVAELQPKGITNSVVDLGWITHGDLDPTLRDAAWKLAAGGISEPVEGRGGLHLLEMVERRASRIPPFAEVAQQIEAREQERVYSEEFAKYMAELEKKSLIVADPPQEAAGFRELISRPVADRLELAPAQAPAPAPAPAVEAPAPAVEAPATPAPAEAPAPPPAR